MQQEEAKIRKTLNFYIIFHITPLLCAFPSDEPPLLGDAFAISSLKNFEAIDAFRSQAIDHLSDIPFDQLRSGFTDRGVPKTIEQKTWCSQQKSDFGVRFRGLSRWQLALLEPDRTFAKYDYWSKVSFLSFDEFLWLSVGLQPLPEFIRALDRPSQGATRRDVVVEHMVAQREIFSRGFDANGNARLKTAQTFLDWANVVQHELHPGFRRMLEKMVEREPLPDVATTSTVTPLAVEAVDAVGQQWVPTHAQSDTKRIDPRERIGMAKLLVAITIEQFGYDPDSKRSPIPKELESIADRLGLEISRETILKYLRLGAQHLPNGWRPHK